MDGKTEINCVAGRVHLRILIRSHDGELRTLLPRNRGVRRQQRGAGCDAEADDAGVRVRDARQAGHPAHLDHTAQGEQILC